MPRSVTNTRRRHTGVVAALLLLAACEPARIEVETGITGIQLTVRHDARIPLDQLEVSGTVAGQTVFAERVPAEPRSLSPTGETLPILLPDELGEGQVQLTVVGLRAGAEVVSVSSSVRLRLHELVAVTLVLELECVEDTDCVTPGLCEVLRGARCEGSSCRYLPDDDGSDCEDGLRCTVRDRCDGQGACVGAPVVCDRPSDPTCSDDNTSYLAHADIGECDPDTGSCVYRSLEVPCADCRESCLGACTDHSCDELDGGCRSGGVCVPGEPPTCDYLLAADMTPCLLLVDGVDPRAGSCEDGTCSECFGDADCPTERARCSCSDEQCRHRRCAARSCPPCSFLGAADLCLGELGVSAPVDDPPGCAGERSCYSGVCRGDDGQPCRDNADCGNTCIADMCAQRRSPGERCDLDDHEDCLPRLTCLDQRCRAPDGDPCADNAECLNACVTGLCAQRSGTGGVCDEDGDCLDGHGCAPDGSCRLLNGAACSVNEVCLETCIDERCVTRPDTLERCEETDDCRPGHICLQEVCRRDLGEGCALDGQCVSDHCADQRCCETTCDGLCMACGDDGRCDDVPEDDPECGVIDCSTLSAASPCRTYRDLTVGRCRALGECRVDNDPEDCTSYVDLPPSTLCRPSQGDCDVADYCDGLGACETDLKQPEDLVCRPSVVDGCDPAETCDGRTNSCPPDEADCDLVELLAPSELSSANYFEISGCTESWACLDDDLSSPDEDASYVWSEERTESELYALADPDPLVAGEIARVVVAARCRISEPCGTCSFTLTTRLGVSGAGATQIRTGECPGLDETYGDCTTSYSTNWVTREPWTWEDLDALKAGVRMDQFIRCTAVWVEVHHHWR